MTTTSEASATGRQGAETVGAALTIVLGMLTVFGPISMDLYLPVLPNLSRELDASTSTAQLTVTACLFGLALGQIIAGPLSDRFGRRRPLLIGISAFVLASLGCAASPSIAVLIGIRFLQGLAGATGIVIAQAAGRDLYDGSRLIRYYGRLAVLGGLAAAIGPVIGGFLASVTDWRGVFVFLAVVGLVVLTASAAVFRETLPTERRTAGGLAATLHNFRTLLTTRRFVGALLVTGFSSAALFAYLAGATFVIQDIYRVSPQGYSFAFASNSVGFMVAGFLSGHLSSRWSLARVLLIGQALCLIGAAGILTTALGHLPLPAFLGSLFVMVLGISFAGPPATALALTDYPQIAGTAAALLGLTRYAFGGIVAPLVGLAGADTAVPLGLVTTIAAIAAAAVALLVLHRRAHRLRLAAAAAPA